MCTFHTYGQIQHFVLVTLNGVCCVKDCQCEMPITFGLKTPFMGSYAEMHLNLETKLILYVHSVFGNIFLYMNLVHS